MNVRFCDRSFGRIMLYLRWLVIPVFCVSIGCQHYEWRDDYERAEVQAREQSKHMFIFYKYYLDADSNRMLGSEVLSDPEVVKLFQGTVNVLLDQAYGPRYVEYVGKYGVRSCPSSIIVAPDGTYTVLRGLVSKERFMDFAQKALKRGVSSAASDEP